MGWRGGAYYVRSASCFYERVETRLRETQIQRESHVARICDGGVCYLSAHKPLSEPRVNTHNASWMDERERVPLSSKQALKAKTKRPRACRDDH